MIKKKSQQLKWSITLALVLSVYMHSTAQIISTVAGNGTPGYLGDGGPATAAELNYDFGAVKYYAGQLYITDNGNNRIRVVNALTGIITTYAGGGTSLGDGGPATNAQLNRPVYLTFDAAGNMYFSDMFDNRIRKIDHATNIITTIAGIGTPGFSGFGGPATSAQIKYPTGIAVDNSGNVYFCNDDYVHPHICKISAVSGNIDTIIGIGGAGYTADGYGATTKLYYPTDLCIDGAGNLYFSDAGNNIIRKYNIATTYVTTIAGHYPRSGYSGDGGPATSATLYNPQGVAVDAAGNVFIGDGDNYVVRKVSGGIISTVAGNDTIGYSGDGGPATAAKLSGLAGVDVDCAGNLYIGDAGNNVIRMVNYFANHPPHFVAGVSDTIAVCQNSTANSINSVLAIIDTDAGQKEWWIVQAPPVNGSLSGFVYSNNSSGGITTPVGLSYTPHTGYSGIDSFKILIADCAGGTSVITIYVTVVAPSSITGITHVCVGTATTLSGGVSGGIWSSSNTAIATVGSGTGIVTGVTSGTATISYTIGSGCIIATPVTVNASPAVIGGTASVCLGATSTLTDGTAGGIWTSSNTGIATVGSTSGIVTGVSSGTATISYTLPTGCYATATVTVAALSAIIGASSVCVGLTSTLTDAATGGTWSSSNIAIASIGSLSGIVTGVSIGTATVTYTLFPGCSTTMSVTVNAPPVITGATTLCAGGTTILSDPATGGIWSSDNIAVAIAGSSTGVVTGITSGTANITYTLGSGCYISTLVSVVAASPITGTLNVCAGTTTTLTDGGGGTWTSGNTAVATIGSSTGIVTGIAAGTATITYTLPLGCITTATITVIPSPAAITGPLSVCVSSTTTLSDATGGGVWSSASPSIATIGSTGLVTGVAAGIAIISYTLPSGCPATVAATVNDLPAPIVAASSLCLSMTTAFTDGTGGGLWSSSSPATIAIGSASGIATGLALGGAIITYMLPTGCYVTLAEAVNPLPDTITGTPNACVGAATTLSDAATGGTWTSSNTGIATAGSSSGIVTGVTTGTATITYTLPTGCYTTTPVTVLATPTPITGTPYICAGHSTNLNEGVSGGTWSSSDITKATVSPTTGSPVTVTEVSAGTVNISYTLSSTGCFVTTTVGELPPISGLRSMCPWGEDSITVTEVPVTAALYSSTGLTGTDLGGGVWEAYAHAPGVDTIFYTIPSGCVVYGLVTVNPLPGAITGSMHVCIGSTTTLSDGAPGGTWSTSDPTIATVGLTTGVVTGVATGTARITYTLPTGCYTDTPVVVNPAPTAITGSGFVCIGSTITLADGVSGGIWTSSNPAIATVGSSTGVVTGIATGTATISYTLCSSVVTLTVTVSPLPAITGASAVCLGSTDTLADTDAGGTWSSSNPAIGSVSSSGVVTGVSAGTVTISYALSTGCVITRTITVTSGSGGCAPCSVFRSYTPLGTSGHITGNVAPGNYYISNNVTVTGNDTFTNAIVLIAPGDTVFVDTASLLVLDSSHMFSLCSEWAGMQMKPGRTHSGRLYVVGNSLVEDAMCAVYIPNAVTPASSTDYIFKSEASTFNRNGCGLFVQHYTPAIATYPFLIRNSVFTSRDFQTSNPRFPYYWPPTYGTGGLKNYWHPADTFSTPLNIDNPHPNPTYTGFSYPGVSCYGGLIPANGIRLDSVGTNDGTGEGLHIPGHYYEMVVGDVTVTDNNQNANLFDVLQFGIYSINSNLTSINNVFADLFSDPHASSAAGTAPVIGGDGIYAIETNDIANQNRLRIYTPAGSHYNNKWYNFNIGVEASNMFQLIGQNTYMMNKSFGSVKSGFLGSAGYSVKTAKYDTIDISYDTITNVSNGVAIWMAYDPTVWLSLPAGGATRLLAIPSQYMGMCNISYNLIQAHPDWTAPLTFQLVNNGISYQNPYIYHPSPPLGPVVATTGNLSIRSNTIHDAYNGIYVNNYAARRTYQPIALENSISVRHWTRRTLQFGVNYTNCNNAYVYFNNVAGTDTTVAPSSDSMRAFYAANNNLLDIGCNQESYIGRGFEFFTNNALTNWHDNHMQNNGKGFVLSGAVIGPQYHGGTAAAPLPMNDYWDGAWTGSNYQTWVKSAHAPSSAFYINAAPPSKNPTNNSGDGGTTTIPDLYGAPSTINIVTSSAGPCVTPLSPMTSDTSNLFSQIAQQHVDYMYNFVPRSWMAQYELWKSILLDSTLVDSSATVAEFNVLAQHSRYKYLTDIEQALNDGDFTTATAMLGYDIDSLTNTSWDTVSQVRMADDSSMDYIVQNYQQYYSLYLNYATLSMSGHDSLNLLALASMCPEVNGAVVYQARALYSLVYNDLSPFNDDSCLSVDSTYFASRHSNQHSAPPQTITVPQQYKLYPNPNNGSFTLQQYIPDDKPARVMIYDMMGRSVYDNTLQFSYSRANLTTADYPPGMYLIEITDNKNQTFRLKFVISK